MKNKILVIACLVLVICVSLVLPMATAYADYENDVLKNPQAIVNMNQLVTSQLNYTNSSVDSGRTYFNCIFLFNGSNWYSYAITENGVYGFILTASTNYTGTLGIKHSGATQDLTIYNQNNFTVTAGHKYYFRINVLSCNPSVVNGLQVMDFIVIDLNQMFGSDNIPTVAQCEDLFVADYYAYNTGSAISLSGIDAFENGYEQGLNAYIKSTEFTVSSQEFYSSVYTVNLNDDYGFNPIGEGVTVFSKNSSQQSVTVYGSNITNSSAALCLPFKYTLPQGTQITITGLAANVAYHNSMRVYVGFWVGSQMIQVDSSMPTGTQGNFRKSSITFLLPFDVDRIYIITPADEDSQANITLKDFTVGYYLTGAEALSKVNFENGYAKAEEYYKELYKVGGAMYDSIYYKGYYDYENAEHFTFRSLISSAVDVPVQAMTNLFDFDILGVNMKTFYLSVFTLCVIFVVLRLVL